MTISGKAPRPALFGLDWVWHKRAGLRSLPERIRFCDDSLPEMASFTHRPAPYKELRACPDVYAHTTRQVWKEQILYKAYRKTCASCRIELLRWGVAALTWVAQPSLRTMVPVVQKRQDHRQKCDDGLFLYLLNQWGKWVKFCGHAATT